jgi:hypothetical protein
VSGASVHVAGYYRDGGGNYKPCYWLGGTRHDLDIGSGIYGDAYALAVSGASVYVAGFYDDGTIKPCYWLDGTRHDLDIGSGTDGEAYALAVAPR